MNKDKRSNISGPGRLSGPKIHILLTAMVMVFIFVQSALPGDLSGAESGHIVRLISSVTGVLGIKVANMKAASFAVRKAAHFTEYMVLGCCLSLNVSDFSKNRREMSHLWLLAWIIGSAYAVTDELHQRFVAGRSCEIRDMMIDAAGVAVGCLIMMLLQRVRKSRL